MEFMKENLYYIEKNCNRLRHHQSTFFLDPLEQDLLKRRLKKCEYQIFLPYPDSEKAIFYVDVLPNILLYQIKVKGDVRHQDILGSLFSLNIASSMFGDIVFYQGHYYVYILPLFQNYFESNFLKVRNFPVELQLVDSTLLQHYQHSYEPLEVIVSSQRIDTVVASIVHTSRVMVKEKIKNKEILLNHHVLTNSSYVLKEGDIFSIRKFGKFKYMGIVKETKKENYILHFLKYL